MEEAISDIRQLPNISFKTGIRYESTTNYCIIHGIQLGTAENIQIELRDDQDATLKNGDSKTVIVDEITRNAQFPLKARAITVNGNASQGTIEALINVIYTWQ